MRHPRKLGRLVTGQLPRAADVRRPVWPWLVLTGLCVALVTVGLLTGWLPAQFIPRQLVIRGCCLSNPEDISAALQASGAENYWQLWRQAGSAPPPELAWVKHIGARPLPGRSMLITVTERLPLLAVSAGGQRYLLCDDGQLVQTDASKPAAADALAAIATRPALRLPEDPGAGALADAPMLLSIAASCEASLPGKIAKIELSRQGEVTLYDRGGLELRLGGGDYLTKIAALPKALRICDANRASLRYLDATDARVFYQKWNHTISSKAAGGEDQSGKPGA